MPDPPSKTEAPPATSREQLNSNYANRARQFAEAIRKESGLINVIAFARLGALVAVVWVLVLAIRHQATLLYLLTLGLFAAFLYLVTLHNRHNLKRDLYRQLKALNEKEQECLEHRFGENPDGRKYADPSHAWSHDLDIFGKGSLFQYINRTSILRGEQLLAQGLTTEPEGHVSIQQRQGIVRDLKDRLDFRQLYTGRGRMIEEEEEDMDDLSFWLKDPSYIQTNGWLFYLALVMSAISLGMVTALILGKVSIWGLLFILLVNFSILSPFVRRTNRYQSVISMKHLLLEGYARLLKLISEEPFKHPDLKEKAAKSAEGMREVARLSRLLNLFDQRLNMLLGAIFNGLFLFDFIMLRLLEDWKKKNSGDILNWIEIIGWTDAMVSLGGFAFNHPAFTWPEMQSGEGASEPGSEASKWNQQATEQEPGASDPGSKAGLAAMELEGLGHPLIPDRKRVDNDLRVDSENVVVITGANMAGKSTFLRSLGINMVLAYTGCPVCAIGFRIPFMGLCSSMRTADSLKDEESYFLAEIKKLQVIVKRMEQGEPLLILLDEVLKGTNTTDKKRGSEGLIRRAIRYPVRCFIATHDLSLGKLEKVHPGKVVNYCFESYINEMELTFDYTIRSGIATNMNASFLMKQMGIMD